MNTMGMTRKFAVWGALLIPVGCSQAPGAEQDQILFNSTFLPDAKVANPYSADLGIQGGTPPLTVTVQSGSLPAGITLSGQSLQGTPTKSGIYVFTLGVKGSGTALQLPTHQYTLVVAPNSNSLSFVSNSLPSGTVSQSYAQKVAVSGGKPPYQFSQVSGQIPAGLSFQATTGSIFGIPSKSGLFQFQMQVVDALQNKANQGITLVVASAGNGKPVVSLLPSVTAGVAPLSVHFDASGTTSTKYPKSFHHLQYDWNFDDAESSHPTTSGPIAGHVFNRPGIYEVRVAVTDPDGKVNSKVALITVTEQDKAYPGKKTVCFSNSKTFSGAPTGARLVTTSSFDSSAQYVGAGMRLLFRRGDTFVCKNSLSITGNGPITIGAFGTGTNPDRNGKFSNNPIVMSSGPNPIFLYASGVTIMDLTFREQSGVKAGGVITAQASTKNCLVLRVDSKGFGTPINISHDIVLFYGSAAHDLFTLADSVLLDARSMTIYVGGHRFMFIGNTVVRSVGQHILRVTFANKLVVDGNILNYPPSGTNCIKLHAPTPSAKYGAGSDQIVIRDNEMRGSSDWLVTVGPQNAQSNEAVKEVLIEKNRFFSENTVQVSLYVNSSATTIRNNLFVNKGGRTGWGTYAIEITQRGIEPVPTGVELYHNTLYNPDAGFKRNVFVYVGKHIGRALVMNNLVYAPKVSAVATVEGPALYTATGNLANKDPKFKDPSKLDFGLQAGSPALGTGTVVPVIDDFKGSRRDLTKATRTIGAFAQ